MKPFAAHPCETACRTPKTDLKLSPLDSTFINSQMLLSRGKENKKGQSFHKSRNDLDRPREGAVPLEKPSLAFLKKRKMTGTASGKVSVKFHSRQPSVDPETNSMLVSPANEQLDFGVHYSYSPSQIDHFPPQ